MQNKHDYAASFWIVKIASSALFALICCAAITANADEQDPINVVAGIDWQHDNNLFRASPGINLAPAKRADQVASGYVGVRIDKQYALQRFRFNYTHAENRFQRNSNLNYATNSFNAAWLWSLTPYLTGNLSADRNEGRDNSQDINGKQVFNVRATENLRFDVDWSPYNSWHVLGGLARFRLKNSQALNEQSDFTQNSVNGGLKYVFASGSSMSVIGYGRSANFDRRQLVATSLLDTGFRERELDGNLNWILTGKSRLNLMLGYVRRTYDNFAQRNFSQPIGSAEYVWTPTGRVQVTALAQRQANGYESGTSSYAIRDSLDIRPTWAITDKVSLQASAGIARRDFRGVGISGSVAREDTEKNMSIGINWLPTRYLTLGANIQRSMRDSNQPGIDFRDTTAGVSAQLFF